MSLEISDLTQPVLVLVLAVLTLALLLGRFFQLRNDSLRHIPGPWYTRWTNLVAEYHLLAGRRPRYVHYLHERYGPVVRVGLNEVDLCDVSAVREIHRVGSPYLKPPVFYTNLSHRRIGTLFSTTDPKAHAVRRRLLSSALTERAMQQHEPTVADRIRLYIHRMVDESSQRGIVDVYKWSLFLTTDTIAELSFGESFRMLERGERNQYSKDLELMAYLMVIRATFPYLVDLALRFPIPFFKEVTKSGARLVGYGRTSIERGKKHIKERVEGGTRPTLFDKMFAEGEDHLTDGEIVMEASGFLVAGSDTTAISLTYLIWAVCGQPEIRDRLVAELNTLPEVYHDSDVRPLQYLDQIISETLRLYPATPGGLPRLVPPHGAALGGYSFPGDAIVSTQVYTLHRDPVVFPDPERFDPSRWAIPSKDMIASLLPFGGGTRMCIGIQLARMELRLGTAAFFRRFPRAQRTTEEGMSDSDMDPKMYFLVNPAGGRCLIKTD